MADLSQLIGALMTSLAHARRIADEETANIAEYYRDTPLLQGLSLPRVRVPEMVLELPLMVEKLEEGEENELEHSAKIRKQLVAELDESARRNEATLSKRFRLHFRLHIRRMMGRFNAIGTHSKTHHTKEQVIKMAEMAFLNAKKASQDTKLTPTQTREIIDDLRERAARIALSKVGAPNIIDATIVTSEVKEKASAGNVGRLRMVIREEGIEWSVGTAEDGTTKSTLVPE